MNAKNNDYGSFGQDVLLGLSSKPKTLSSKYLYDSAGDKLFQQIMDLPEYYLTRKEFEILEDNYKKILAPILAQGVAFNLVELGAGDGLKTKILLRYLTSIEAEFTYYPVDFSGSVLVELKHALASEVPSMEVETLEDSYRGALKRREWENGRPSLILFLGSNLGNFSKKEALDILDHLRIGTQKNDYALIGFDLKKDPSIILSAYNDAEGITEEFNLNLMRRINRELEANFDVSKFTHWPTYNPVSGECRSYLVSKQKQTVYLKAIDLTVHFKAHEAVFMEISRKYSLGEIARLAEKGGFKRLEDFIDSEEYFANVLWQRQ